MSYWSAPRRRTKKGEADGKQAIEVKLRHSEDKQPLQAGPLAHGNSWNSCIKGLIHVDRMGPRRTTKFFIDVRANVILVACRRFPPRICYSQDLHTHAVL